MNDRFTCTILEYNEDFTTYAWANYDKEIIHILRIVTIGGSLLNNLNSIWNCEIALELVKPWSDKNENAEDNTATEHEERHQELANITDPN